MATETTETEAPDYEVGAIVEYRTITGSFRRARVTARIADVNGGGPGFDAVLLNLVGEPVPDLSVWGWDDQILSVETARVEARLPGQAFQVLRDSQLRHDDPNVERTVRAAAAFRRGRGYVYDVEASAETMRAIADYLQEHADLDAEMTLEESTTSGRSDARAAREAARRIRRALEGQR